MRRSSLTCSVRNQALSKESEWLAVMLQVEELSREVQLQQRHVERLAALLRRLAADV